MFESFIGHVPRIPHCLLADSVDTSLVVQQMRCSVKRTISERAEKDVLTRALSGS